MFSRDVGGYIVPAARRVANVVALAVRNLAPPDGFAAPDAYFLLATADAQPIYRSEVATQTCNPTWLPIDWEQVAEEKHQQDERLLSSSVVIRVLVASRRSNPWDAPAPPASGRAFFSAAAALNAGDATVVEALVDLRALRFISADVHSALAAPPPGDAAAAVAGGGGGSGIAAVDPPGVAELPLNALLLQLTDGFYSVPPTALLPFPRALRSAAAAAATTAAPVPPGGFMDDCAAAAAGQQSVVLPSARYDMRRAFDALNRLMQLRRDTVTANTTAREAAAGLAVMLGAGTLPHETNALTQAVVTRAMRVAELRQKRDAARAAACAAHDAVRQARSGVSARAAELQRSCQGLQELSEALPCMEEAVEAVRSETSLLRMLITAKQLSLIADLRQLYPISEVERGRQYTIRGLSLPHRDTYHLLREEHLSTVLGYTAHTVALLAKYLQVPLRYAITHAASRSTLRDEVMLPAGREFPLYGRAAAPDDFACAAVMLARDVRQLLHSQGLAAGDAHVLADLQRLFSALLDSQLAVPPQPPLAPAVGAAVVTKP